MNVDSTLNHLNISCNKTGSPSFSNTSGMLNDGPYGLVDDYGISCYFRGGSINNYVKFGKNKDGADMYWRIIRINGDGSLRMIYDGTSAHANKENDLDRFANTKTVWNSNNDDAKYVGYMYGGANGKASTSTGEAQTNETDSIIKIRLENWYKENIVDTGYSNYVGDEIFCNDRSMPGKKVTNWTYDSGLGYGKNRTAFGAWGRFLTSNYIDRIINPKPTFKCLQQKDAFTVNDTEKGNGALTYPVGLITADEVVTAGGRFFEEDNSSSNRLFYLHKGYPYYTFSPSDFNGSGSTIFIITGTGELSHTYANDSNYIAPVINISAEYAITLIGKGTATDPYRIE